MCLAIPGRIIEINEEDATFRKGKIDFGGVVKEVSLACLPEAEVGKYALVHAGLAISLVDEDEANQVFEYLRQMEELDELAEDDAPSPKEPS